MTLETPETLVVLLRVIDVLESLGVPYHVGGSWASSVHGIPRQTQDVDVVSDLDTATALRLVARLAGEFYVDAAAARDACVRRDSFNLVHLQTAIKIDIFVAGAGAFDRSELQRGRRTELVAGRGVFVKSPEDAVLRKLQWYRAGGEVSERQWTDVLGILRVQGAALDHAYLARWAVDLGVTDLLQRAATAAAGP
jgi:hypothetical protein